jgi:hypothetical protein
VGQRSAGQSVSQSVSWEKVRAREDDGVLINDAHQDGVSVGVVGGGAF